MSVRTDKAQRELIRRYKLLRAVRVCLYNQLHVDVEHVAREFFFVAGEVMEGNPIQYSTLTYLKEPQVKAYLKEDR